jgi:hypothetical protein
VFKFQAQEARDDQKQAILFAEKQQAMGAAEASRLAKLQATTDAVGAVGGAASSLATGMQGDTTIGPATLFGGV